MAKEPRWANENWIGIGPDLEKIDCKDCAYRAEDREHNGQIVAYGAELAMCDVYEHKPVEIMINNTPCPYYLSQFAEDPEGGD